MKQKLLKLSRNKFIQGGAILTSANFIVNICGYLFHILSARIGGPIVYGEIVALFSYMAIIGIPTTIIVTIIIRRLSSAGEMRNAVAFGFEQWLIQKAKHWWWLLFIYFFPVFFIPKYTNLLFISALVLLLTIFIGFINSIYGAMLLGAHYFLGYSISIITIALIKIAGPLFAFFLPNDLIIIYSFIIIGFIIGLFICIYSLHKNISKPHKKKPYILNKSIMSVLFEKVTIIACMSLLGMAILGNADIIIIKKLFSASEVGIYGAWSLFAKIILFILAPLNSILLIFFSSKSSESSQKKILFVTCFSLIIVGSMIFLTYRYFGSEITNILGSSFHPVIRILPQAALFGIAYAMVNILNQYFIARKSYYSLVGILSIPLYIILLLLFGKTISNFITINIIFTMALTVLYIISYMMFTHSRKTHVIN